MHILLCTIIYLEFEKKSLWFHCFGQITNFDLALIYFVFLYCEEHWFTA